MEKVGELDTDSQSVEDWLEIFEARADCLGIHQVKKKVKWCKSVIGGVGRKILKNLPQGATWEEAKQELRRFLGEEDPKVLAWRKIRRYQAEGKPMGEVASDVLELANLAAGVADVRQKLAVDAFLEAVPWKYSIELKKRKIDSVEDALTELKLLKRLEEEEEDHRSKTLVQQEVQYQASSTKTLEPTRTSGFVPGRREVTCWACGKKGHIMRNCYTWAEFKKKKTTTTTTSDATVADNTTETQLN